MNEEKNKKVPGHENKRGADQQEGIKLEEDHLTAVLFRP